MPALKKSLPRVPVSDPLWQKFLAAPVEDGPLPEAEQENLAEAMRGSLVPGATVTAEIGRRAAAARKSAPRRRG